MKKSFYIKHKMNTSINVDKIVSHIYYEFDKNYSFVGESHDFWEMVYVDKGEVTIKADDRIFPLKQGEAYFHQPNEFHNIRANGVTAPDVFITAFVCRSTAMNYFKSRLISLDKNAREILANLIKEGNPIFGNFKSQEPVLKEPVFGGQQMMKIYMEMLLIMLIRNDKNTKIFSSKATLDNHITSDIKNLLKENVYGLISIQDICKTLHYGKTYLCQVFKEITGTSIMRYYSELKVKEAKTLIREKKYNFTEISNMLMFNNPHYFSHVFKNITGMTPREYKNSVRFDAEDSQRFV